MSQRLSYREALNQAIAQEMARDDRVFVFGLDVQDHKALYGTTKGLRARFGGERCFGTPLSEDAMTGLALGAALNGLRPIHVHIRVDFLLLAVNQIFNMISNYRYVSGGKLKVPLVIRAVIGRGWGQGAQHSKSLHSIFAHVPGLKVVLPTTPNDAKGLLISAVRDDNPVIFIEHRWLYDVVDEVTVGEDGIPLGVSNVLRKGRDATVVATSWMNVEALKAAEILARRGVEVEVIDPRTVFPLDDGPIIESAARTGHCLVADNDWTFCGFSAELAARISEGAFAKLKSPVTRIGFAPVPCPTTRPLEQLFYPNAATIVRALEKKLGLSETNLAAEALTTYENRFKGPF